MTFDKVKRCREIELILRDIYRYGMDIPNFQIKPADALVIELRAALNEKLTDAKRTRNTEEYEKVQNEFNFINNATDKWNESTRLPEVQRGFLLFVWQGFAANDIL